MNSKPLMTETVISDLQHKDLGMWLPWRGFKPAKLNIQLPISILPVQSSWMGRRREDHVDELWHQVPPLRVGGGGELSELGEGWEDSLVISSNSLRTTGSENGV